MCMAAPKTLKRGGQSSSNHNRPWREGRGLDGGRGRSVGFDGQGD